MPLVVIGGHSRSVGKTSVVAGLIAALRDQNWTAVKITQYGHGVCSRTGTTCDCACPDGTWMISEDLDRSGDSDTSRFLVAGAKRSLWLRTQQGKLGDAMPALRRKIDEAENVIIESNSVLRFVEPDLYVSVLDPGTADFKKSARDFLTRADAVIIHAAKKKKWDDISIPEKPGRPIFQITPPPYVTAQIADFVRTSLK